MSVYDITLPVSDLLAVWPGDTPYHFTMNWRIAAGASVNVGSICSTVHVGTHADAPLHFRDGAAGMSEVALDPYIGPAIVIDVAGRDTIRVEDVAMDGLAKAPRLLLRTDAWTDYTIFPEKFPVIDADVPDYLRQHGVLLIGVDVPSVDAFDSKDLPIHHALDSAGIRILESLYLNRVPEGIYELIALPLNLVGADGAPVRAVLRSLTIR